RLAARPRRNVLGPDLALETYSQIIDGLPLASVAFDKYGQRCPRPHPIARHTSLCPGSLETAHEFLSVFSIDTLDSMPRLLLRAYQSARPGNRSFRRRLIELVAVAVHKVAVFLFNQGHRLHDREIKDPAYTIDAVTSWQPSLNRPGFNRTRPCLFMHFCYDAVGQYPGGVANAVGYWAENRVLGGVVMFDRSEAWDDEGRPEPNVYFHSDRDQVAFRVWQALNEQHQSLVDFLLASQAATSSGGPQLEACPFPMSASNKNLKRFSPDATRSKVYRDIWEREPPRGPHSRYDHCVLDPLDYPEHPWSRMKKE
ncbi:hypothetical protein C8A01DRAFT_19463, partial [Parachaetomium inaequale]